MYLDPESPTCDKNLDNCLFLALKNCINETVNTYDCKTQTHVYSCLTYIHVQSLHFLLAFCKEK